MEQYINKDALVAEIEKKIKQYEMAFDIPSFASYEASLIAKGKYRKLLDILKFLNTLEVKEVDLQREIDREIETRWRGEYLFTSKFCESAKHFFELGLRVSNNNNYKE